MLERKKWCPTKETAKKMKNPDKNDVIEVNEYDEEEDGIRIIKWNSFETHYLIAIRGEMNGEVLRMIFSIYFSKTMRQFFNKKMNVMNIGYRSAWS